MNQNELNGKPMQWQRTRTWKIFIFLMSGQSSSSTTYKNAAFKVFVEHRSTTSHPTKGLAYHSSSNGYPSKATQWFFKAAYWSNPMVFQSCLQEE
jgi:hypothetical protein